MTMLLDLLPMDLLPMDLLQTLGAQSVPAFWLPLMAWTLLALPATFALDRWHDAPPLVQQWARQALLAALPLGLAAAALTDVAFFEAAPSAPVAGGSVLRLPALPAAGPNSTPAPLRFGFYHGVGLAFVGASLMALWQMGRLALSALALARFRKALPCAADAELERAVRHAAGRVGLRHRVRAVFLDAPVVPMTFGLWRPVVVLPASLRGAPERLQMTLAHELAHVRRGDILAQWTEAVVAALFAVHPLAGHLRRTIASYREEATDAAVLADRSIRPHRYARLLRDISLTEPAHRLPALTITEDAHSLTKRLRAMKNAERISDRFPRPKRLGALLAAVLLAAGLGLAACSDSVAPDEAAPAPEAPASTSVEVTPPPSHQEAFGSPDDPDRVPDTWPGLKGGLAGLSQQIAYPELARKAGIEGRVFVQFVVDEEGHVADPIALQSPHELLSEEALRVTRLATFEPGRKDGEAVPVKMTLPLTFKLPKGEASRASNPVVSRLSEDSSTSLIQSIDVNKEGTHPQIRIQTKAGTSEAEKTRIREEAERALPPDASITVE